MKTYKLNLKWKKEEDDIYGKCYSTQIWNGEYLRTEYNGEDWYNVIHYNSVGHELDGIGGARKLSDAKEEAENWVDKQLKTFMVRE